MENTIFSWFIRAMYIMAALPICCAVNYLTEDNGSMAILMLVCAFVQIFTTRIVEMDEESFDEYEHCNDN